MLRIVRATMASAIRRVKVFTMKQNIDGSSKAFDSIHTHWMATARFGSFWRAAVSTHEYDLHFDWLDDV